MTDFVYPVNDRDPEKWGDDVEVLEYFASLPAGTVDKWYWASSFRLVEPGDRIWVYAAAPHSRIVAMGLAEGYPQWSSTISHWRVPVRWSLPVTRVLLRGDPPPLSHSPRSPRRIGGDDLDALLSWLEATEAPERPRLSDDVVERYRQVRQRQGQPEFRRKLVEAYDGRCAVTRCDVQDVLEAAHIEGYTGRNSTVPNGLLLRADIHTLFDAGLLWIDGHWRVRVADEVSDKAYRSLHGVELHRPARREDWPDKEKLRAHREGVRR